MVVIYEKAKIWMPQVKYSKRCRRGEKRDHRIIWHYGVREFFYPPSKKTLVPCRIYIQ